MQNLRRLIIFLCLHGSIHAAELVRILDWNLEWFPGKKPSATQAERDAHFLEVAAIIPQLRADIIVLQEVRNGEAAEALCRLLPGFSVHVTSRFSDPFTRALGEQQIVIMSRLKADGAWAESWKRGWANAPRGYAYARFIVGNRPLHVYGLHLKSNLGDPASNTSKREDAMEQLLSHIEAVAKPKDAVIVAGDFNTSKEQPDFAGDRTLRLIEKAGFFWSFEGIPLSERITIPGKGRYPDACFDHVYTKGLGRPAASVIKGMPGSDHFPVMMDVTVEGE